MHDILYFFKIGNIGCKYRLERKVCGYHLRFDGNTKCKEPAAKLNFKIKIFVCLHCILFRKVKRSFSKEQGKWFVLKMAKEFLNHLTLRANSDFMILDAWMSILRNVYISNNVNSFIV